jgi:hypothetical protein
MLCSSSKSLFVFILAAALLPGAASAQPNLPGQFPAAGGISPPTQCAVENGNCSFSGARTVIYGVEGKFSQPHVAVDGIPCNNGVFGDPAVGTGKACFLAGEELQRCALENGRCSFTGLRTVAYGARYSFNTKTAAGGIDCNNGTFGDPLVGTGKACYLLPNSIPGAQ